METQNEMTPGAEDYAGQRICRAGGAMNSGPTGWRIASRRMASIAAKSLFESDEPLTSLRTRWVRDSVEGLTKSAALEVAGTGVRVNVVAPGTTDTGMLTRFTNTDKNKAALVSTVPVQRLAAPEEIAHVIAFVASANASYMTGASIPVDGGMIAD
jgi:hypothetical protein